ncbi:MAG: hypothetical protein QOJ99_5293 [Bryobacterales bacterium]|jgi:hypothetical protein|nr:hypothetical protein [Bryobacterales bacterium]
MPGPSRWYQFWLSNGSPKARVNGSQQTPPGAADGNLLETPYHYIKVPLAAGSHIGCNDDFSNHNDCELHIW